MKVLDRKGRLFGRINIVDFSIIVLTLVIIPTFFHIYNVLGKMPTMVRAEWVKVEAVTFTIPEFAELIKKGNTSYDENGNPDGRLLEILRKSGDYGDRLKSAIMPKMGNTQYEHTIPLFLEFELPCTRSAKGELWYYKRKPLFVSLYKKDSFIFTADKYKLTCYAIKIED